MSQKSKSQETEKNYKEMFEKILDRGAKAFQYSGETIETAIKSALSFRDNVIMVRVNKESLNKIDELVDAGLFKSRSESAAFLIREGIKARNDIFIIINEKISEIQKLKEELKNIINSEFTETKVDDKKQKF
jgi:Arc/MetJ-type ribon-helix-helix transcriptional regulator